MRMAEKIQILLVLGITKTVNPLVFIIHICSVCVLHVCYGTIHLLIQSVSQKLPLPSQSNQTLGLVQQVPTVISCPSSSPHLHCWDSTLHCLSSGQLLLLSHWFPCLHPLPTILQPNIFIRSCYPVDLWWDPRNMHFIFFIYYEDI